MTDYELRNGRVPSAYDHNKGWRTIAPLEMAVLDWLFRWMAQR